MNIQLHSSFRIPEAPKSIQKGVPLKHLLGPEAVECMAHNIRMTFSEFDAEAFRHNALDGLEPLGILQRGQQFARALRQHLPKNYASATEILLATLTPPLTSTDDLGLAVFYYLPHICFVAECG